MRNQTCMFTGHRIIPLSRRDLLWNSLLDTVSSLYESGVCDFIVGGALGFDTMAAKAVLELKKKAGDVKLHLYLPCKEQDKYWSAKDREIYKTTLDKADSIIYVSEQYTKFCMHERNRKMVDDAGICVAFLEKERGGTAYTVNYAISKGLTIIKL